MISAIVHVVVKQPATSQETGGLLGEGYSQAVHAPTAAQSRAIAEALSSGLGLKRH